MPSNRVISPQLMLRVLKIHNLAIIPEATVTFEEGFNVLTGETGAGKSILIDAISLLAGGRASSEDVRSGEAMAAVEGVIDVPAQSGIWKEFEELGLAIEKGELILRRTLSNDGRSRAFVNENSITASSLAKIASHWVDISGQHGQQMLLSEEHHLLLLDQFGGTEKDLSVYQQSYSKFRDLKQKLNQLLSDRESAKKQQEFLKFQHEELSKAQLKADEYEELETRHRRLSHGAQLATSVAEIESALSGDGSAQEAIGKLSTQLRAAQKIDPTLSSWQEKLSSIDELLQELSLLVSKYQSSLEFEPDEIERINDRVAQLQSIRRKYGSIDQAISERDRVAKLLASIEDSGQDEKEIRSALEVALKETSAAAKKLSVQRAKAAHSFSGDVSKEMKLLGMPSAELKVELIPCTDEEGFGPNGSEIARILFAPNLGEGFKPLSKIASGGELSRVLLAMKSVSISTAGKSRSNSGVTYLFDEVDSGIGGETAERVGVRMRSLSKGAQVLCVTHLAQIACYATVHMRVEKEARKGRTSAIVATLGEKEKTKELARMIGGISVSQKALDHADELLQRGQTVNARPLTHA